MRTLQGLLILATLAFAQAAPLHSVVLTWSDPNVDITGQSYNVYRTAGVCPATLPANPAPLANVTTATYTDTAVVSGKSYCYWVTVVIAGPLESGDSNSATAVVSLGAPTIMQLVVK